MGRPKAFLFICDMRVKGFRVGALSLTSNIRPLVYTYTHMFNDR